MARAAVNPADVTRIFLTHLHSDHVISLLELLISPWVQGRKVPLEIWGPCDCYDNAVMEAFFSTLKTELADHFDSHGEAKRELFDYIDAFYNTRRRHSTLDYVSPAEDERGFWSARNEQCA
jgi:ribonuclease BN (tRNA processing enzyme)